MKLKASHHWLEDGRVVVEIKDHEREGVRKPSWKEAYTTRTVFVVFREVFPRGLAGQELKKVKKTLLMAAEVRGSV